jgi:phosphatidylserine/phosphatidylglycerophosphate/cardiolipin synthase-like enzyme
MTQPPFAATGSYPVRSTPEITFFVDGDDAFAAIAAEIEEAKTYVYITCAYASLNFRMRPPNGEQLGDLCARLSKRGVRVALLFWQPASATPGTVTESDYTAQMQAAPAVLARWDVAKTTGIYPAALGCHHQKTFIVDGAVAFVGGINMTQDYWDASKHSLSDRRRITYDITNDRARDLKAESVPPLHDVFARFTGAAVSDVEANFVERWNGATNRRGAADLSLASVATTATGSTKIQIVRTIAPHTYPHTANGERSIKEAMLNLLRGADRSVYFENQYFFDDDVVAATRAAGERGVRIVGLLCAHPDAGQTVGVLESFLDDRSESVLQWTKFNPALAERVQLYSPVTEGVVDARDIYVHSKTMIVDDRYVLTGSANIAFTSMDFHSEMCVLVEDAGEALDLRRRLWAEHLCITPSAIPGDFEAGANLWIEHADRNAAVRGKQALASRVVPLHPPAVGDDVPAILDGGSDDDSGFA